MRVRFPSPALMFSQFRGMFALLVQGPGVLLTLILPSESCLCSLSRFAPPARFLLRIRTCRRGRPAMSASMTAADLTMLPAALTVPQAAAVLGIGRTHAYEAV